MVPLRIASGVLAAFIFLCAPLMGAEQIPEDPQNDPAAKMLVSADLDTAAAETSPITSSSHKVIATGWPSTSPMWPSIETADVAAPSNQLEWPSMVEPFIYADKPRTVDYSLLLAINKTVSETLMSHQKPVAVRLSFEFYFNCDPKVSALPGIKIEINRQQFKYLDPSTATYKPRVWTKFGEQILVTEAKQFENHDWLKFSLVNRQSPSLVAIRRLKVEFVLTLDQPSTPTTKVEGEVSPQSPSATPESTTDARPWSTVTMSPQPAPEPTVPEMPPQPSVPGLPPQLSSPELPPQFIVPARPNRPERPTGGGKNRVPASEVPSQESPPPEISVDPNDPSSQAPEGYYPEDQQPAASDALTSTIKPVKPAKSGSKWNPFGRRRRKRQAPETNTQNETTITLTCYQSDSCPWNADINEEAIQWSLARMPPSTGSVQTGYFYVSNRVNYGNSANLLILSLNQTDLATIADQNSDHCIEVALYITERTRLRLYRLLPATLTDAANAPANGENAWLRGNVILSWSPTIVNASERSRESLPGSRMASMENGNNGWTFETLCYGDFFANARECGSGKCAFGFEMDRGSQDGSQQQSTETANEATPEIEQTSNEQPLVAEQVVGVALLREHTVNLPQKVAKSKWLETWQREEVEPGDSWKFYPKMDVAIHGDNVSLVNLHDESHYYIQSEWLSVDAYLDFTGMLAIEFNQTIMNATSPASSQPEGPTVQTDILTANGESRVFALQLSIRLVDSKFDTIHSSNSTIEWSVRDNITLAQYDLNTNITDHIKAARAGKLVGDNDDSLFKIVIEFVLFCKQAASGAVESYLRNSDARYKFAIANVSVSDRCFPSPCKFGSCQQNDTGIEDWNCQCDERHRGRRCEFGRWCSLAHVTPWQPPTAAAVATTNNGGSGLNKQHAVLKVPARQPKADGLPPTKISGKDFCQRKLGTGSRCTEIDLPLNDNLYTEDEKTFSCSCQDDYYLSDDAKCKQAHLCHSIVCPSIGMICDETKPFNKTQPCQCNEKQDWHLDPQDPNRCARHQCHDKQRDCGFDAHICLPTLAGEKPICKCGPKFALKTDDRGRKNCESTACNLPTLNDCQQICQPDNNNLERPFTCACHAGYQLEADGKSCKPLPPQAPVCRPACQPETQICTDLGCRCKQGYIGEGEVIVKTAPTRRRTSSGEVIATNNLTQIDYVQAVRCLNVCSLTYAENKREFGMVESVCPLGLCDPLTFQCRCSDPSSSALVNSKYEPIYANETSVEGERVRVSPLCHLRRVCEPDSISYKICRGQGAICVPDYTRPAMFDCICPPSTEKKYFGQGTSSEFTCEPKCSAIKYECLRRQATCKLVDKDEVRCDCLPGHMLDAHDHKCYLAKYSYAINLILVNRYYEPESKFHRIDMLSNSTADGSKDGASAASGATSDDRTLRLRLFDTKDSSSGRATEISELVPQFSSSQNYKSIFIADYNQCNVSQVIPKAIIEDPYEHDIESFLGYIDQCNEKIHQNVKTYHLNSRLSEDVRQSLRQHLRGFTVTTSNSTCTETDSTGMYLNCTIYLQSNGPIPRSTVEHVFNNCDKHGQDERFCWIKPRLLLKKTMQMTPALGGFSTVQLASDAVGGQLNFRQIIPCELDNFCGLDSFSVRADDRSSLCSCKCPPDIEVVDVKDLEPKRHDHPHTHESASSSDSTHFDVLPIDYSWSARNSAIVKEICAPRNHCGGSNSTFCLAKAGSKCHYDVRLGSRCVCVYPSYEDELGRCVEVAFSQLDNTLIVIIIMLGTGLIVSIAINLYALARSQHLFARSKQYPLNDFPSSSSRRSPGMNRSTGVPNLGFDND